MTLRVASSGSPGSLPGLRGSGALPGFLDLPEAADFDGGFDELFAAGLDGAAALDGAAFGDFTGAAGAAFEGSVATGWEGSLDAALGEAVVAAGGDAAGGDAVEAALGFGDAVEAALGFGDAALDWAPAR